MSVADSPASRIGAGAKASAFLCHSSLAHMHELVLRCVEALIRGRRGRPPRARRALMLIRVAVLAMSSLANAWCSPGADNTGGPQQSLGSIHVTTKTVGTDIDPDGYEVSVDQDRRTMLPDAFERFQNLSVGPHTVSLAGQAENCSLSNNPRQITASYTAPTSTTFDVTCVPHVGRFAIETFTSGTVPDPDGYTVTILGQTMPLPLNGRVLFNPLPVGSHSVTLGSLAQGCQVVMGSNPRTIQVRFNTIDSTLFAVGCNVGLMDVTTATTGVELDPDGYFLSVDGVLYTLGVNATLQVGYLSVGVHQVGLVNVSPNCVVAGLNPRPAIVSAQLTVQARFDVTCGPAVRVAFESDRDGDFEIFSVRPDGTELRQLTTNGFDDLDPDWSHDGTQIAFARHGDIWVMNADGTNDHVVVIRAGIDDDPDWSPDGTRILFESDAADGTREIFVMNATGPPNVRQLTNAARDSRKPHFSPNGASIVFVSDRAGNDNVFTMDTSGTNLLQLTTSTAADHDPAWSPTGTEIVFSSARDGDQELWIMNANGSVQTQKTFNTFGDWGPAWAADGTIAFTTDRNGNDDIYLLTATPFRLTAHPGTDGYADWRAVTPPTSAYRRSVRDIELVPTASAAGVHRRASASKAPARDSSRNVRRR